MSDIEKLIKTKIEIEPFEFEGEQPDIRLQGRINDGRRMYQSDADGERSRRPERRTEPRPVREFSRPAPRDPFFDKPYEPSPDAVAPSWEAQPQRPASRISPNIKPKVKVAALFKAS